MNVLADELADAVEHTFCNEPIIGDLIARSATTIAEMNFALKLAKALLERTGNFNTPISSTAINSPTIGQYIDRALAAGDRST